MIFLTQSVFAHLLRSLDQALGALDKVASIPDAMGVDRRALVLMRANELFALLGILTTEVVIVAELTEPISTIEHGTSEQPSRDGRAWKPQAFLALETLNPELLLGIPRSLHNPTEVDSSFWPM